MPTKIKMGLSIDSVQKAIEEVRKYKTDLNRKCEIFCQRMTELGKITAEAHIAESPLGKYIVVTTNIIPETMGCKAILMAVGEERESQWQTKEGIRSATVATLMMVEFGAGASLNQTQNPYAGEFGMGVGTFPDQTHAFENSWSYFGMDNQWHTTKGIKATMPMYNADTEMILHMKEIAQEVFRS